MQGKKIIIGITASIAAYKTSLLIRLLVKAGAEVKVICTPDSLEFVTPLTLSTLSKNPVYTQFTLDEKSGEWANHVELGLWADLFIVAPLSANTLAKMATGRCDNLLMATYLSARCPVLLAPAMDLDMYLHPSTANNLKTVSGYGNMVLDAEFGELASGLSGQGRMAEPENIFGFIEQFFQSQGQFAGKNILITAGPTQEKIDPVRYISNYSTGKMGYAIAKILAQRGAQVTLVSGPTHLKISHPNINIVPCISALDMYKACQNYFPQCHAAILAAAVADFRPELSADQKIKKNEAKLSINLTLNPDILASLGQAKKDQILIGFALETENELDNAVDKLKRKNLDMIVLNSLNDEGAGFGSDLNKVTMVYSANHVKEGELKSKDNVAADIVNELAQLIKL